jgi:hypothetical protein
MTKTGKKGKRLTEDENERLMYMAQRILCLALPQGGAARSRIQKHLNPLLFFIIIYICFLQFPALRDAGGSPCQDQNSAPFTQWKRMWKLSA